MSQPGPTVVDRCADAHLRHCHGTWVIHADGTQECTDPGCETPGEAHALTIWCTDDDLECACG